MNKDQGSEEVVRAAQLNLQTALVHELKMPYAAAGDMVHEASQWMRQLLESPGPMKGRTILFAVRPEPPQWMKVTPDTEGAVIDANLGSDTWKIVDVTYFLEQSCDALVEKLGLQSEHARWNRRMAAKKN